MAKYKETLSKAKSIADQITVEVRDGEPFKGPPKKEKEEEKPKKNQLVKIPTKMELAYRGRVREEDLDVDDPVHILLEKFRAGEIDAADLSVDDKFVIIRHMREVEGKTQDKIAEELGVTRRTVINYCNKIKEQKAQALADTDIWELGGELYSSGMRAMEDALKKGKYKDFAYLMTSLISTLQSMGLIFKMPKQSQVSQQIVTEIQSKKGAEGFKQLKRMADSEEINLDNTLNEILAAVKDGKLDKKDVDK